jgi:hypothetical protein
MFFAFFSCLLMLNGAVGVLVWLAWQRVSTHMRNYPEAARLVAEHVLAPILTGQKEPKPESKPEVKTTRGTLV